MTFSKIKAAIVTAAVLALGITGTMALFTANSTSDINVTSSKFELEVNSSSTGTYAVNFSALNLKPGEPVNGPIVITNNSTIPAVITYTANTLDTFTVDLQDSSLASFTTVTLAANGGTTTLDLAIELPDTVTSPPADQTLTLKFTADQGN